MANIFTRICGRRVVFNLAKKNKKSHPTLRNFEELGEREREMKIFGKNIHPRQIVLFASGFVLGLIVTQYAIPILSQCKFVYGIVFLK